MGGSFPANFQGFFIWGGIPPALFYSEVAFGVLLNTVFDLTNIINNYSNYHGVSEKKVKLITYIDHKSDLGGEMLPPKNLAFLGVGGNFKFLGGIPPLFPSAKYPCGRLAFKFQSIQCISVLYS